MLAATLAAPACAFDGKVGGSLREQVEIISDDGLGSGGQSDRVLLHRLLLRLDGSVSPTLRGTLEFDASAQGGRNGGSSPVDESEPDLHQSILEWDLPVAATQLRVGRQEWTLGSGRLVSVRDGPNIRRAFDAVQLRGRIGATPWRAFLGRPVRNRDGSFDDREDRSQHLGGFEMSLPLSTAAGTLELYALDYRHDDAEFSSGNARERRRSVGARWHARGPVFDFNTEAVVQDGEWGDASIRAWTLASDAGWQVPLGSRHARVGLKADVASGDGDPDDSRLQTFNALYPNPSYFSDAALIAPANLIDLQPNVGLPLSESMRLYAGWNLLWKHRRADAVYTTPVPLTPVAGSAGRARWIGQQAQCSAQWTPREFVSVEASYVHFRPGRALSSLQEQPIDFLQLVLTLSF
ncbi:alginate export protein [Panacagrimonas perspica]|uniref:Alginate export protein n=1 Tax=Panacagrimonas perspica TaxID=381431 RepID=A0A4V3F6A0_9GAMM|nr:alginate export protein [Panacagrimonas perspica]